MLPFSIRSHELLAFAGQSRASGQTLSGKRQRYVLHQTSIEVYRFIGWFFDKRFAALKQH